MALFSRVLMGFGSAFAFVGILKLATLWLPPERFAMIAGMTTSLGMLGAMFGENVLTHLVIKAGWRPTLSYLVVVGIILAVFLWLIIRDKHPSHTNRFTSTTFRALFIGIFLVLRRPQIWICAIVGGILYTSLSVFAELWAKPYLQDARGFSPQTAALLTSMVFLGWAIGGPLMGYLSDRLNSRRMPLVLGAVLAIFCFLFVMYTSSHSVFLFSLFLFLFGLFSSTQNIVFAITQDNCERMLSGSALALTNMFVMLMGMVLQPLVGEALDYSAKVTGSTATKMVYTTHDYRVALLVIPILYVISAIAAIFLKKPLNKVAVPN